MVTVPTAAQPPSAAQILRFLRPGYAFWWNAHRRRRYSIIARGCDAAVNGGAPIADGGRPTIRIFANNQIPADCMDPTAVDLLQALSLSNPIQRSPGNVNNHRNRSQRADSHANQFTVRFDHTINDQAEPERLLLFQRRQRRSALHQSFKRPAPNVPGFGSDNSRSAPSSGISRTPGPSATTSVNEFRVQLLPGGQLTFQHPSTTELVTEFVPSRRRPFCCTGTSVLRCELRAMPLGIHPGPGPNREGVPFISSRAVSTSETTPKENCRRRAIRSSGQR